LSSFDGFGDPTACLLRDVVEGFTYCTMTGRR
jgi:hypothetical protein